MELGIITIFGDNYGNKLQNYALQALLEKLGHEAETVIVKDGARLYCAENARVTLSKLAPGYIRQVVSSRFKNKYLYKNQRDGIRASMAFSKSDHPKELAKRREDAFKRFADQCIKLSADTVIPGQPGFPDRYDAYVCGSDQVWNPNLASSAYFLQFAPERKRIACAPSFGVGMLPESLQPIYKKWLAEIPYLSVREERGADIIRELTGRDVPVVPDPTLCLSREEWERVEKKPDFADRNYVLTYFLGNETNKYRHFIETYAKKMNLKIIDLYDMREPAYYAADPAEFVWLIHHAKAMFTDSFHGTVFSLIFHTPFLVFDRIESGGTSMSSRIETLLKMVGMEDRRFRADADVEDIDFSGTDATIKIQAEKAVAFLRGALESVSEAPVTKMPVPYVWQNKQDCTGCAACVNVCPVRCITMETDDEGFRYPKIDLGNCIHCDKCRRLCAEAKAEIPETRQEAAFVAFSKNNEVRQASSSGGMFSELAGAIADMGGTVYGAGFMADWSVAHRAATNRAEIAALRGSKYVQSKIDPCFAEIKEKLERGELVYFSGTPCQVDALLAYLNRDYEKLYTQDIICHGVPSPEVWKSYVTLCAHGERISNISFRSKAYGWHYFSMCIETDRRRYLKRLDEDVYTRLFLENVILRPSCYACAHKHPHRKTDITLADCWGNTMGLKDDDKGISIVFANTEKGRSLVSGIRDRLELVEVPFEKAASSQGTMTRSVPYNRNRELFFANAAEKGMRRAIEEWYGWDVPVVVKRTLGHMKYKLRNKVIH